jgi:dihydrofolate reductase
MQGGGGPQEDTSGGFALGGWAVPHSSQTTGSTILDIYGRSYDLVLGRKTYDIWVTHWPRQSSDNPIARAINSAAKYVASRSKPALDWHNSHWLGEDVVASLRKLKSEDGPDLLVPGSSDLLQTLWKNNLVDEFSVLIYPVVLGKGKRLFGDGATPAGLRLVKTLTSETGVIIAYYEFDGPVRTGSFAA